MKDKPTTKITFRILESELEAIQKLAISKHTNTSALIRKFIEQGMSLEKTKEDEDYIRRFIREELDLSLESYMKRIIALQVKIGTMSTVSAMSTSKILAEVNFKKDNLVYDEVLDKTKKEAGNYLKVSEKQIEYAVAKLKGKIDEHDNIKSDLKIIEG